MATIKRTVCEFSSNRKVRGIGSNGINSITNNSAAMTPSKTYYEEDSRGNLAYFITFNIGNFRVEDVAITTEGRRLTVKGEINEGGAETSELNQKFTRSFTIPDDVDPNSINKEYDAKSQTLYLIGKVVEVSKATNRNDASGQLYKLGAVIRENKTATGIEYEIYVGDEFKNGKVNLEVQYGALVVRVSKSESDNYGDTSLELRRQIKLASGTNTQNIEQRMYNDRLAIKIPLR